MPLHNQWLVNQTILKLLRMKAKIIDTRVLMNWADLPQFGKENE